MKSKIILAAIAMSAAIITYSQPVGTVQFYVGYSLPTHDLRGDFGSTYSTWTGNGNPDTNTYFMKSGINYGIYVKFPVKRKSPLQITGGIGFDAFSNSVVYDEDSTGTADIDLSQSHLVMAIGGEYNLATAKSKFNPFIGAELTMSFIAGKLTIIYPSGTSEYTMNSTVRFGVQFGAGADYVIHHNLGLSLGAKYAIANLIGKSYESDLGTKYNLGDGEHTAENGAFIPAKTISYFHFYGGLSFYFGR
jgi:hypothetical protein